MNWFAITLLAYFLLSLEIVLDKFLISSKRVSHPIVYAFYSGTLGMFALVFVPFGFHLVGFFEAIARILAGMVFIYGMMALFFAVRRGEASRVAPVIGAITPITVFLLSMVFLGERLESRELLGIILLIAGGLLISFDISEEKNEKIFKGFGWSILAGILLAVSATTFKHFYRQDNFLNVYIWTRAGAFLGVLVFFLVPKFRKLLLSSLSNFKKPKEEHKSSGFLFVLAKTIGGTGSILKEKATSFATASVTLVNALVAVEYVFVFVLGILFSLWFPSVFEEKKDWRSSIQKIISIVIIAVGIYFVLKRNN